MFITLCLQILFQLWASHAPQISRSRTMVLFHTLSLSSHILYLISFSVSDDIKSYQFVVKHFLVVLPQGISSNPWQKLPRHLSLHFFSAFVYPCKCHLKWESIGGLDYFGCYVPCVLQPVIISLPQGGRDICCGFRGSPRDHEWLHPNREAFSNGNSCSR